MTTVNTAFTQKNVTFQNKNKSRTVKETYVNIFTYLHSQK